MLAPLTASASATTPRSSNPSAASATASSGPSPSLVTAAARASEPPRAHVDDVTLGGGGLGTAAGESRSAVRAGFTLTARGSKSSAAAATNVLLGGGMNCVGGVEDDDDLRAGLGAAYRLITLSAGKKNTLRNFL